MLEGWIKTTVGEVVTIASGQVDPKDDAIGRLLSVGPDNLYQGGGIDYASLRTAKDLGQISGKYAFDSKAILYSKIRPNLNKAALPDFDGICSADMYPMWISDPSKADREFVYYVLTSERFVASATSRSFRTGLPKINREDLESIFVVLPPLPEQRRIAQILRTWDEAIEKLEALRSSIIERRSWIRSNILSGEIRLGNFNTPWEEVAFSEVLHEHGQNSQPQDEVFSVSVHKGLINQIEHLGRSFSAANTDHYNRVLPGDIVYTKSPTGDFPLGIIKQSTVDAPVIVSPLYGVFTPETRALGTILDAYFESPVTTQNYLHPLVQKGAKNTIAITNTGFLEGKLKLPRDSAEQEAIAEFIETDRAQVKGIDAEIDALQRQKRGLMQKLLTGEWRVNASEANILTPEKEIAHG